MTADDTPPEPTGDPSAEPATGGTAPATTTGGTARATATGGTAPATATGGTAPVEPPPTPPGGVDVGELPNPSTRLGWGIKHARAVVLGRRHRAVFADVERFCFFVGYPRSGHSLVGSLLNAHPEILIAHELDAARHVEHHFGRAPLYALLLERDQVFASRGRSWAGYDYVVPNQFQGRWTRLRVIGDKRGRGTAVRLGRQPELLDRVRDVVGVPIRVVHVTRNPYDNIATMARQQLARDRDAGRVGAAGVPDVSAAVAHYAQLCKHVETIRQRLAPDELHDMAYETFVADTQGSLTALCAFVGVEAGASYAADCAGVVWPQTRRSRDSVEWTDDDRRRVEGLIAARPFLEGYSWDT